MGGDDDMRALVLVVDDEPLILLLFEDILESAGYDVIVAPSADAAKALLEQRQEVSLILLQCLRFGCGAVTLCDDSRII